MPIYEYACEKCESEFEVEQRITDDPVKSCPECRSRRVKRLISKTSFVLKGSGWYADLYASDKGKDAKTDDKPAAAESAAGDSAGDAKPDGKDKPKSGADSKKKSVAKGKSKKAVA